MQRLYVLTHVDGINSVSRVFLQQPTCSDILMTINRMFFDIPNFIITVEEIEYLLD